jgi:hypothetical protein
MQRAVVGIAAYRRLGSAKRFRKRRKAGQQQRQESGGGKKFSNRGAHF